jgi:hypothetical protein
VIALTWAYSNNPDEFVVTRTHEEIDAVLDKVAALSDEDWPAAAHITKTGIKDIRAASEFIVGFHVDRGVLLYSGPDNKDGSLSVGDGPDDGEAILYMIGNQDEEFPPNAEIPLDIVRRAAHEFAETGLRPTDVPWRSIRGTGWV